MPPTPLPSLFVERLKNIIPPEYLQSVIASFSLERKLSVRINTLKVGREEVLQKLAEQKISFMPRPWSSDALVFESLSSPEFAQLELAKNNFLYRQALSSMLPVIALDPHPGEHVLDFCAAPGSKTTQIAAFMNNTGELVAVEAIKGRFFKLKAVCQLLGADRVAFKLTDARRFKSHFLFDKILVDAPCSSEGRFSTLDKDSFGYWSPRKIKEMVNKQRGLLLSASRLLKPGGVLVYSTCTFAPEENEGVVDWALRKAEGLSLEPITFPDVQTYPALTQWEGHEYSPEVQKCVRILPNEGMEGFFMAKFRK